MNRKKIILLALFSLLVFILVQFYLLILVWNQEDEILDLRYRTLSRDGIDYHQASDNLSGFEDAYYYIDYFSSLIHTRKDFNPTQVTDSIAFMSKLIENVRDILTKEEELSAFLKEYYNKNNFDTSFTHIIKINEFTIISGATRYVIPSKGFLKEPKTPSRVLVSNFQAEGNNFSIDFDYFIDFTNKKEMIIGEILATIIFGIMGAIGVVILYLITFRNLMEERRLSELKTDFINNMTHELKTPLATITVAGKTLELEQVRRDDARLLETAKLIGKQSIHLNQLINLILETSSWERKEFDIELTSIDIDNLLAEIAKSFVTGCNGCVKLEERYRLKGAKISVDIVYFTTAINNLLTNSVKYSGDEPEVMITTFSDQNWVFISIKDNGIGIPREEQHHVFDKFYRVSHGNVHKSKGLGLGLYYVKRIIEAHRGSVRLDSKPGKGSTFTIVLPNR